MLLARVATGISVDWSLVVVTELADMMPDKNDYLRHFPEGMRAADLSSMIFGRCDWALLVSLYACLWGDVKAKFPAKLDHIERAALNGGLAQSLSGLRTVLGMTPAPSVIVESMFSK